ncbi:MAG: hypothetical protein ACI4MP_11645 [Candidatus Ventricola sp.]
MRTDTVTVHVRINAGIFRRFALFDTFRLKRRWVSPAVFCAVFLAFSFLCMASGREQADLIGTILQIIGLGLPVCYVLSFMVQVHDQCRRLGLKTLRPAYTLNLCKTELRVINDMQKEPEVVLPYASLHGVWRASGAYYLYAAPARAFILPDGQCALSPAELYDLLTDRLPQGALHGRRP